MRGTEKRINRKRRKPARAGRQAFTAGILLSAIILTVTILCGVCVQADTPEVPERYKYFTSVYVDRDDNLWDIAKEYMTEEYRDIREYVSEVMTINHLADEQLQYGERITVPYYSSELK